VVVAGEGWGRESLFEGGDDGGTCGNVGVGDKKDRSGR